MKPPEFEENLTNNINAAMRSQVHPTILIGILHTKAVQLSQMLLKGEQPPEVNGENVVGLDQPQAL